MSQTCLGRGPCRGPPPPMLFPPTLSLTHTCQDRSERPCVWPRARTGCVEMMPKELPLVAAAVETGPQASPRPHVQTAKSRGLQLQIYAHSKIHARLGGWGGSGSCTSCPPCGAACSTHASSSALLTKNQEGVSLLGTSFLGLNLKTTP